MAKRMGYEGKLYWGTAGSTASTELTEARDVSYTIDPTKADTSDRSSILKMEDVAQVAVGIEFEVTQNESSAFLTAAQTAVITGGAMAFRTRSYATGWGMDGDFTISFGKSESLTDAQRVRITATPTDKAGRAPGVSFS